MENIFSSLLVSLVLLLGSNRGCGDDEDEPAPPPTRQSDPELDALKKGVLGKTQQLLDVPYESYIERFTPSAETGGAATDIASRYKSLIDQEDYGIEDYQDIEQDYLGSITREFKEARGEAFDPIRERYIAENLYESGPGFQAEREFGEDTAQGVGDITKEFAYEGIQRKQQQMQYQDALKRGDYTTMYNMALSEINREQAPVKAATQAELAALGGAQGLFGELSQLETAQYGQDLSAWETMQKLEAQKAASGGGNFGGLGSALGMGAGILLAAPTGGMSMLAGGALGSIAGGGVGSMIEY